MADAGTGALAVATYCNDALGQDDATGVAGRIAGGEISAGEAVDAAIDRLRAAEPSLNGLVCNRIRAVRQDATRQGVADHASRLFAGVPTVIKDNTDLAGLATRHGSRATPSVPRRCNDAFADQFLSTGLLPIGKSRLPEFGLTATTEFEHAAPTRNPWRTDTSPGGSSGGSAALVAAGVVPIAHANDGGGSTRIPAACCGLVGLKPSRGRLVPNAQGRHLPIDIIADGILSRSVRDTANFLAAADTWYRNPELPPVGHVSAPGKHVLRIGLFTDLPSGGAAHPECVTAAESAAQLCAEIGHHVEPIASPLKQEMADDFLVYYGMMAASLRHAGRLLVSPRFDGRLLEPLTRQLAAHFRRHCLSLPGALQRLKRAPLVSETLMSRYDVLLSPTLGQPPAPLGYLRPDLPFEVARQRLEAYAPFTPAANVCGSPAVSLPLATSWDGLPIGVQFAAGRGRERTLLELAFALEQASPWPSPGH